MLAQYSTDVKEEFMWNMEKYLTAKGIVGSPKPLSPVQEWNAALSEGDQATYRTLRTALKKYLAESEQGSQRGTPAQRKYVQATLDSSAMPANTRGLRRSAR